MSKKKSKKRSGGQQTKLPMKRDDKKDIGILWGEALLENLALRGYTPLDQNPEIVAGCRKIASLISTMTIYIMENAKNGDRRIQNELSRKLDIEPWKLGTRRAWMDTIVMNLLLYGNGNSIVLPITEGGILDDLRPIPAAAVSFRADPGGYTVAINGKPYDPEDLLHFKNNPDKNYPWKGQGYKIALRDLAQNINQARETEKGFMESKWKPSIIVKVDGLTDEFSSREGRQKLLDEYIANTEAGEPWLIPADQFSVDQIKPLSISDLAINETVTIDKKTVAAILGVPAFVLGEGKFETEEWNNFINTTIRPIAEELQQEMTRKLILSPRWYVKFNIRSLYAYDIEKLANVGYEGYNRGILMGNEVRDWLGLNPLEGLDELIVLENYIPLEDVGKQKKLDKEKN